MVLFVDPGGKQRELMIDDWLWACAEQQFKCIFCIFSRLPVHRKLNT